MYIHGIYIVYYACIIHSVAGVEEEGRVPFLRSPSNHIAWTSRNFYFAPLLSTLGIPALVNVAVIQRIYQVYTRYIPGIFKVYTKGWAVDKRLDPVAALAPGYL